MAPALLVVAPLVIGVRAGGVPIIDHVRPLTAQGARYGGHLVVPQGTDEVDQTPAAHCSLIRATASGSFGGRLSVPSLRRSKETKHSDCQAACAMCRIPLSSSTSSPAQKRFTCRWSAL